MLKRCLGFILNKFIHFHMHSKAKCVRTREDSEREKIQKGDPGSEVFLIPGSWWFSQRFDFRASSMIYRIVTQLRHGLDGSAQGKKNHFLMKNFISFNSLFYSRIDTIGDKFVSQGDCFWTDLGKSLKYKTVIFVIKIPCILRTDPPFGRSPSHE